MSQDIYNWCSLVTASVEPHLRHPREAAMTGFAEQVIGVVDRGPWVADYNKNGKNNVRSRCCAEKKRVDSKSDADL